MATEDFKRKLTAVMSADVVGYSRLTSEDEADTVQTLNVCKEIMFTLIKQHRGRVIDSPGDNLLAEYASVVDAVQCAVAVQIYGDGVNIAARLEALADLGGVRISKTRRAYGLKSRYERLRETGNRESVRGYPPRSHGG